MTATHEEIRIHHDDIDNVWWYEVNWIDDNGFRQHKGKRDTVEQAMVAAFAVLRDGEDGFVERNE